MKVNTKIYNQLRQMIDGRVIKDLTNVPMVVFYLRSVKADEAAEWIVLNTTSYRIGIAEGFEIDNSQKSQLKDIHNQ
jgi:hypothetical protein